MNKKYKIPLIILLILIILCICLLVFKQFVYDKKENKQIVTSSVVDNLEKYGYSLDDRDTKIYEDTYYELKEILDSEEINYDKYAEKIASLFVIDLLTISNKINKYDVGGLDFLYEEEKEMFKNKVMDTLYKDVEDNSYDNRKQQLPTVTKVTVADIKNTNYELTKEKELEAYELEINVEYEKDLEYDEKVSVIVVKDNDKMHVVKYTAIN
ncbi:MAG: hypothetical protein J6B98_06650 [Bacilli bacterium]|nr:hypothetical protein [Bacilli bacterium]